MGATKEYMKGKRTAKATMPTDEQTAKEATHTKKFSETCQRQLSSLEAEVRDHEERFRKLVKEVAILDAKTEAPYIISDKYNVWHRALPWLDQEVSAYKSHCGWRYGRSVIRCQVEPKANLPKTPKVKSDESRCPRCFPFDDEASDDEFSS